MVFLWFLEPKCDDHTRSMASAALPRASGGTKNTAAQACRLGSEHIFTGDFLVGGIPWVIKCPHVSHHPTIRYIVYNGYYKVMSNIPKMGHLPTPVYLHLWKIWFRQLGSLFPIYGQIKFMFQTTNQMDSWEIPLQCPSKIDRTNWTQTAHIAKHNEWSRRGLASANQTWQMENHTHVDDWPDKTWIDGFWLMKSAVQIEVHFLFWNSPQSHTQINSTLDPNEWRANWKGNTIWNSNMLKLQKGVSNES